MIDIDFGASKAALSSTAVRETDFSLLSNWREYDFSDNFDFDHESNRIGLVYNEKRKLLARLHFIQFEMKRRSISLRV